MVGVDGSCLVEGGGGQRVVRDAVDLSRQPTRALEQGLDGRRLEERQLAACETGGGA